MVTLRAPQFDPDNPQSYADFYEQHVGINWHCLDPNYPRMAFLLRETKDQPPGTALEIGCGEGVYSYALARLGWRVHAADVAGGAIAAFAQRLAAAPYETANLVSLRRMRAEDLRDCQKYDLVVAFEILEHVPQLHNVLKAICRALVDDGRILVTTPHVTTWDGDVDHVRRFTAEKLAETLGYWFLDVRVRTDDTFIYAVGRR